MVDVFFLFSYLSGLKPNFKKSEIAGIVALRAPVAVHDLRCIDLNNATLRILGTHF